MKRYPLFLSLFLLGACSSVSQQMNPGRIPASVSESSSGPLGQLMKKYTQEGYQASTIIRIEETHNTPSITIDTSASSLAIAGESTAEYGHAFYQPLIDWSKNWVRTSRPAEVQLSLQLRRGGINSVSIRSLVRLAETLTALGKTSLEVTLLTEVDGKEFSEELAKQLLLVSKVSIRMKPSGCSARER